MPDDRARFAFDAAPAGRALAHVLATVNAPRPHAMDAPTLLACLAAAEPDPTWRQHLEALFDEVSADALHDLVLAGVTDFADLDRAARTWRIDDARNLAWIKEMADLGVERAAARRVRADRHAS